jgi:hypothetical protein
VQGVRPVAADEHVPPAGSRDGVVAVAAVDEVIAGAAGNRVIAGLTVDVGVDCLEPAVDRFGVVTFVALNNNAANLGALCVDVITALIYPVDDDVDDRTAGALLDDL